jgi:trk system potassium uptake protein TrkA
MHDCVELPETYKVQLFTPPEAWVGRDLRDLALRRDYNISVLAVKKRDHLGGWVNEMPAPERPLAANEQLIIVGEIKDLEQLLVQTNARAFHEEGLAHEPRDPDLG